MIRSVKLSVVVVSRNEARTIAACLESVGVSVARAREAGIVSEGEVLLVDSASEDETVEIAKAYPIRILRLPRHAFRSAGAGTFVGVRRSSGDVIAIVNGDMTIEPAYFEQAIPYLRDDVGAVLGIALEELGGRSLAERLILQAPLDLSPGFAPPPELEAKSRGTSTGTLLLVRDAVERVGPYNPFLVAAEDYDIRTRLVAAGYRVLNIPVVEGRHFWADADRPLGLRDILRTLYRNSTGLGQLLRLRGLTPSSAWPILRRAFYMSALVATLRVAMLAGVVAGLLAAVLLRDSRPLLGTGVLAAAIAVSIASTPGRGRERLLHAFFPTLQAAVRIAGIARGFSWSPRRPEEYSTDVEEVQTV